MESNQARSTVLWTQVSGLAALQAAITLTWVIYGLYVPQLLEQFGFPKLFAAGLLVVENLLAIGIEPFMGSLSDRMRQRMGSQFPLITAGIVLAATLFITIPAIVLFGNPQTAMRWVLPVTLVAWAIAMAVFRSPALSLLGNYAIASQLPQAMSLLMFMSALVSSISSLAHQWLLNLGFVVTFATGSFTLLAATAILRAMEPQATLPASTTIFKSTSSENRWHNLSWILAVGLGIGLGVSLMKTLLNSSQPNPAMFMAVFSIAHLLTVIPAGRVASRLGNQRALLIGLSSLATAIGLLSLTASRPLGVAIAFLLGTAFSLVINGTIPFALSLVSSSQAGLGTGLYFAGSALASSLFGTIAIQLKPIPPVGGALVAIVALVGAAAAVNFAPRKETIP